jgi:protein involved in polysaccharide export with SLBB domain
LTFLRAIALSALVLAACSGSALSQTTQGSRTYRVVVGDVLQVEVAGRPDISGQYTVDKDGNISLPVVGSVTGAGRTTAELGTDISRRISILSRDIPQVTVWVVQAFRRKNFVLGAVLLPGSYTFAKPPTVWEAVSEAGGPTDDADLSAVQIISESLTAPTIVDLAAAVRSGELASLPRLRPGDTVRVPRGVGIRGGTSADLIYVFGAVGAQGPQPLAESSDLARAVIRSAPAPDANLSNVEIVRRAGPRVVSMRVNLQDYVAKASTVGNPQLYPGDTIYLPRKRGSTDYLRVVGVLLGVATSIAVLTNN